MSVFLLNGMVDDDFETGLGSSSDVSNPVVHLRFVFENQGHSFCKHVHATTDASPMIYTGT